MPMPADTPLIAQFLLLLIALSFRQPNRGGAISIPPHPQITRLHQESTIAIASSSYSLTPQTQTFPRAHPALTSPLAPNWSQSLDGDIFSPSLVAPNPFHGSAGLTHQPRTHNTHPSPSRSPQSCWIITNLVSSFQPSGRQHYPGFSNLGNAHISCSTDVIYSTLSDSLSIWPLPLPIQPPAAQYSPSASDAAKLSFKPSSDLLPDGINRAPGGGRCLP